MRLTTLRTQTRRWGLLVIMLVALALIVWRPEPIPLTADEGWSKWMSGLDWHTLFAAVRAYEFHPPLYYGLLKLWREVAGSDALALRLPSVVAGLGLVVVAYRCAARLGVPPLGAAALVAVQRLLIVTDRLARPYALFDLAVAGTLLVVLHLPEKRPTRAFWFGYVIGLEAVLWLHALGMFYAFALALALLLMIDLKQHWRAYCAVHLLAGALYLPCLYLLWLQHQNRGAIWLVFNWAEVIPNLAEAFTGERNPPVLWLTLGLALIGGLALNLRNRGRAALALAGVALVPILFEIGISATATPVFLMRYVTPSILPILLLVTASLAYHPLRRVMPVAFAIVLALFGAATYRELIRPPEEKWDQIAGFLSAHVAGDEEVWVVPNDLITHIGNNGPVPTRFIELPVPFPPPGDPLAQPKGTLAVPPLDAAHMAQAVALLQRRHPKGLWLVSSHPWLLDPQDVRHAVLRRIAVQQGAVVNISPVTIEHWRLAR